MISHPLVDLLILGVAPWTIAAALAGSRIFPGKQVDGERSDVKMVLS